MKRDTLSQVLRYLHLKSSVYFQSDFPSGWGMHVPEGVVSQFHLIVKGDCLLETDKEILILEKGDIAVFPFGDSHQLYGRQGNKVLPGMDVMQSISNGESPFIDSGFQTRIICGHFEMDLSSGHPLVKSLPRVIHLKKESQAPWLMSIAEAIVSETATEGPGSGLIAANLAEVLFIHVLRTYISTQSPESGFLAALFDEKIGESLSLMHHKPESHWTLEGLAIHCGMSRTIFANRFRDLVGVPPKQYLTELRMIMAGQLLLGQQLPILEVAERVGYGSEAAFIRSFKKKFNITPAQYRRSA